MTVRGASHRGSAGIRFHRAALPDLRDVTRIRGVPCTTPARAILEIAPQLSDRRRKRLVRKAQAEKLATTRRFADVLRRAPGYAGAGRIAAIIATGAAPTYSGDEDEVLDLVLDQGFEHPHVNQRLIVGAATRRTPYFPDLRWPAQQLILEIDSAWHDDPLSRHTSTPSGRPSSRRRRARPAHHEAAGARRSTPARRATHRGARTATRGSGTIAGSTSLVRRLNEPAYTWLRR